jgi:hypothetical protein
VRAPLIPSKRWAWLQRRCFLFLTFFGSLGQLLKNSPLLLLTAWSHRICVRAMKTATTALTSLIHFKNRVVAKRVGSSGPWPILHKWHRL